MTKFYINPSNLGKILHQNGAECIEAFEGSLQDNGLYITKSGAYMAIYEHYLNDWTSNLYVEFSKDPKEKETIYNKFTANIENIA